MLMNTRHPMLYAAVIVAAAITAAIPLDQFKTANGCHTLTVDPPEAAFLQRPYALRYRKVPMQICARSAVTRPGAYTLI
jgi:hypothetical protein